MIMYYRSKPVRKSLINVAACVRSQHTGHIKQVAGVEMIAVVDRGNVFTFSGRNNAEPKKCF